MATGLPIIPETITVHLGEPDQPAPNVTVPFLDYVLNVASSEIYATWPDATIRANVLAIMSFTLNRVYTEFYRSRGSDFDITNNTAFDQAFVSGRSYFENISRLVDELFNDYLRRPGFVEPLAAKFCNGTTVTCQGLSQWGSENLARQGYSFDQILRSYYGNIEIVPNAPIRGIMSSYPGTPLRVGSTGPNVVVLQVALNRIAQNYPAIPRIAETNGFFTGQTEAAVRAFQGIFNLVQDGVVGKATWYKIRSIYNGIKRLNELYSEGITPEEARRLYPEVLRPGDTGQLVRQMQYLLAVLAYFDPALPTPPVNGSFDEATKAALQAFQRQNGLTPDGILGPASSAKLLEIYRDTVANIPPNLLPDSSYIYPGRFLLQGSRGDDVTELQRLLNRAAEKNSYIPTVTVDGNFGAATEAAVRMVQQSRGLEVNGIVGPSTWDAVVHLAQSV